MVLMHATDQGHSRKNHNEGLHTRDEAGTFLMTTEWHLRERDVSPTLLLADSLAEPHKNTSKSQHLNKTRAGPLQNIN